MSYKDPEVAKAAHRNRYRQPGVKEKSQAYHKAYRAAHRTPPGQPSKAKLWSRYGLTPQDVSRRFARQEGVCWCCGDTLSLTKEASNVRNIDHDHSKKKGEPGHLRSLLCGPCNRMLGNAKENPHRLLLGALYLARPQDQLQQWWNELTVDHKDDLLSGK